MIALLLGAALASSAADDGVRERNKEFSFGSHPILRSDVVEMDLKISPLRQERLPLDLARGGEGSLGQEFGFEQRLSPTPFLGMSQSMRCGVNRQGVWTDASDDQWVNPTASDRWEHVQRSELSLHNESRSLQFTAYEQFRQIIHDDDGEPDSTLGYGVGATLGMHSRLSLQPEWRRENRRDSGGRAIARERTAAKLPWKLPMGWKVVPEAFQERFSDARGPAREQDGWGLGFEKKLSASDLTLNAKTLWINEFLDANHPGNQNIQRLESALRWSPKADWSVQSGGAWESRDQVERDVIVRQTSVFTQLTHKYDDAFRLSLRGDYRTTWLFSSSDAVDPVTNSRLNLAVLPEWQVDNFMVASASFRFGLSDDSSRNVGAFEQTLEMSLRRQF